MGLVAWAQRAFHKTGSPRWFFAGSRRWMVGLYVAGIALIVVGSTLGLGFVPPERYQGDSFRILFVHVPAVHLAQTIYIAVAVAGLVYLVWRMKMAELVIAAAAPVGMAVTAAGLATGVVWGIPTWGTGWVWDARIMSTLVLLLLFFGLLALRQAIPRPDRAAMAVSLLAVVGAVNLPIIKYSVEWFTTLHQPASLTLSERPAIAPVFLVPLALNALGYYCLAAGIVIAALRMKIIERESGTSWVADWLDGREHEGR